MTLTKMLKEAIERKVLTLKYEERESKMENELAAIVEGIIAKQSEGLPLKECCEYVGTGSTGRILGDGIYKTVRLSKPYPIKCGEGYPTVAPCKEIKAKLHEIELLKREREESKRLVRQILNSCNTAEQLLEAAPEIAPFVPEEDQACKALVPIGNITKVRQLLKNISKD